MPSAEERFDQASDNTRAFLKGTVQECSSSEHVDRTELCRLYKDWCVFNRINPFSARRLYKSVWEIFRVKTQKRHRRECFRASGCSPKMPKRPKGGQMRQVRQMRGRFKIAKLPQTPKLDRFPLSFERGRCCSGRCGRFFRNFFAPRVADSPKLIQSNSTRDIS